MLKYWGMLVVPVFLAVAMPRLNAASYSQIIVFGDSLSDYGNNNVYDPSGIPTCHPGSKPSSKIIGTWAKQLAAKLGLPLEISAKEGTNYAWSGATTGTVGYSADPDNLIDYQVNNHGIASQIQEYLSFHPEADPKALYVISGGGNDFLAQPTPAKARESAAALQARMLSLAQKGVKNLLLVNMPPYDKTPLTGSLIASFQGITPVKLKAATESYNLRCSQAVLELEKQFPELRIIQVDSDIKFRHVVAHPAAYALENVTETSRKKEVDPDKYLFWDELHPTARGHEILADYALQLLAVPRDLVSRESFDQNSASGMGSGWLGSGWSGQGKQASSGLGYEGCPAKGGAIQLEKEGKAVREIDPERMPFAVSILNDKGVKLLGAPAAAPSQGTVGSVLWIAFLVRPDESGAEGPGAIALNLKFGSGTLLSAGVFDPKGNWAVKSADKISAGEVPPVPGQAVLLAVRIRLISGTQNDEVDLFVNPVLGGADPSTPAASLRGLDIGLFNAVELEAKTKAAFDEIAIGRSWAAVSGFEESN